MELPLYSSQICIGTSLCWHRNAVSWPLEWTLPFFHELWLSCSILSMRSIHTPTSWWNFFQINFEKKIKNLLLQTDVVPAMILTKEEPGSNRRSNTWENLEIRKRCSYWTTVISSFCETDMQSLIQILGSHWVLWENIRWCSGLNRGLFLQGGCCPISHISLGRSIPHCGYQFTWLLLSSPVLHTQCVLKVVAVCPLTSVFPGTVSFVFSESHLASTLHFSV